MLMGRAEIVSILKCILRLDHKLTQYPFNFEGICYIISSDQVILSFFVCFCLIVAYAALTPVQFLFSRYTRFISWFEKLVRKTGYFVFRVLFFIPALLFYIISLLFFNADKSTRIKTERHQLPISCQKLSTWFVFSRINVHPL